MTTPLDPRLREGIAAAQAKRLDEARTLLQQAVDATPGNALAWFWLAAVSPTAETAVSHLRRAVALDPSHTGAREALARILVAQATRMCEGARRLFREAATAAPTDAGAWRGLVAPLHAQAEQLVADAAAAVRQPETMPGPPERATRPHAEIAPAPASDVASTEVQRGPAEVDALAPQSASTLARTVLVVDDSPTIRKILSLTLGGAGYAVAAEADGESAIRWLDAQVPDVILLDIAMPGIDGYETCKRIRGEARTANVPILMLSGKDALFDKVKGHMAGATEYLTKPFEAATVLAAVDAACPKAA
jgi:twitching motility two-component system response regulator PilG